MIGPRERRRRARQRGRALVLSMLLVALVLASSMTTRIILAPGKWDRPMRSELASIRRYYEINGNTGDTPTFFGRYEAYVPYFIGEVDDPALCGPVAD